MNSNSGFPKKYVISTEIYHERLKSFFSTNESVGDAHVVMGVNALKAQNDESTLQAIKEQSSAESMWPLGSICCGLAHYQVFQECIKSNEPVTIFEDDAILVSDFDALSEHLMMQMGTDWDIIQRGFNWDSFLHIRFQKRWVRYLKFNYKASEKSLILRISEILLKNRPSFL